MCSLVEKLLGISICARGYLLLCQARYGAPLNLSFHLNRSAAYLKFFVNSATWNEPVSAGLST